MIWWRLRFWVKLGWSCLSGLIQRALIVIASSFDNFRRLVYCTFKIVFLNDLLSFTILYQRPTKMIVRAYLAVFKIFPMTLCSSHHKIVRFFFFICSLLGLYAYIIIEFLFPSCIFFIFFCFFSCLTSQIIFHLNSKFISILILYKLFV